MSGVLFHEFDIMAGDAIRVDVRVAPLEGDGGLGEGEEQGGGEVGGGGEEVQGPLAGEGARQGWGVRGGGGGRKRGDRATGTEG